jgi:heat shock protein HslJ
MRSISRLGLLAVSVVVLAACSTGAGAASPSASAGAGSGGTPATTEALSGRTFLSTGIEGADLAEGSQVRLTFEATRIGASAGCNQMSGEYEVADGALKVGMLAMTEMACEEPLMSQDTWLAAFLDGAAATLDGDTLSLTKDDVTLTLLDEEVANPDQALEGTTWVVDGIVAGDAVSSVPVGAEASLTLEGGKLAVSAGCNTGSGTYSLGEGSIELGAVATTRMACPDEAMALEAAVLQVLTGQLTYAIDADTLTLTNGANGLILKAAS